MDRLDGALQSAKGTISRSPWVQGSSSMDGIRFDRFSRILSASPNRRGFGRALAGLALGGTLIPQFGLAEVEARKKKPKKCKGGKKKCGKKCIPATSCCKAADCGTGGTCAGGACFCGEGFTTCQGRCIPVGACCFDDECPA